MPKLQVQSKEMVILNTICDNDIVSLCRERDRMEVAERMGGFVSVRGEWLLCAGFLG